MSGALYVCVKLCLNTVPPPTLLLGFAQYNVVWTWAAVRATVALG